MKTIRVGDDGLNNAVHAALEALQKGEVAACPTDTVYGLLADATDERAVERVFEIKGRERGKALPVFVKDMEMAERLARVSAEQKEFLKKSWPGKVTAILESKHALAEQLETDGTIALRIPNYELVSLILQRFGRPVTGTSANVSGQPSCSSAQEVAAQFGGRARQPDLVLDAGELIGSNPSKIFDITKTPYTVIRS